jgi:hypothetical protein
VSRGQGNTYVRSYWKMPRVAEYLVELRCKEMFRVDDPSGILPPNFGDAWRLDATMGHGATALVDYISFRGTGWGPYSNANALLNTTYIPSRVALPGMKKVFEDGDAIYRNPRAVSRAFVASRYLAFARREEILKWIPTPLFAPRETVLLEREAFEQLPAEFRKAMLPDSDGIRVRLLASRTAADKKLTTLSDDKARHDFSVYKAPWGWSAGDEIRLGLTPEAGKSHAYLLLTYYPVTSAPSRLLLKLDGAGTPAEIPVELAGLESGGPEAAKARRQEIDLGPLDQREHILSIKLREECSARIDNLRVVSHPGLANEAEAGLVEVTSFKPNAVRMAAIMKRSSFVVLSEVNYAGWQATIDGKPAPLLTGDYILRAVPVPEGRHSVELQFRPVSFYLGLLVSFFALAISGACWFFTRQPGS